MAEAEARRRARGTPGVSALVLPSHLVHSHFQSTALGDDSSRRPTTMQYGGNQERGQFTRIWGTSQLDILLNRLGGAVIAPEAGGPPGGVDQ